MSADTLFDIEVLDDIRRAYDAAPALSAFSRVPVPLELARGTRSHSRAMRAARSLADHDCPWIGPCHCVEDGSLCTCAHQHGEHGDAPREYDGACIRCRCEHFEVVR